jgi:hypothetical protein
MMMDIYFALCARSHTKCIIASIPFNVYNYSPRGEKYNYYPYVINGETEFFV